MDTHLKNIEAEDGRFNDLNMGHLFDLAKSQDINTSPISNRLMHLIRIVNNPRHIRPITKRWGKSVPFFTSQIQTEFGCTWPRNHSDPTSVRWLQLPGFHICSSQSTRIITPPSLSRLATTEVINSIWDQSVHLGSTFRRNMRPSVWKDQPWVTQHFNHSPSKSGWSVLHHWAPR